ncbi:MAG: 30S ribosome-binding factor RbfA [Calditrichaeota bacterium]|nr:MAG: 30S ribosome-binding factor RbfA [Calditrichota bacterium]MBL1203903.1 30S ribosome-binding factor RbfA [Calditrichota bacterium]NOG43736.1 30S ribosome-binding factor RbfA [Calditrichota bacterium]
MADSRRLVKYAGNLKKEISFIIDRKVNDPEKGFITINAVRVSPDLKIASIYYTVLGDDEQKEKSQRALDRSKGFIRNELKPSIKSRWLPELRFFYDDTIEHAHNINKLLNKIHDSSGPEKGE